MFDALGPYRWSVGNGIERLKQLLDEPTDEDILASHMSGYEDISDGPTETIPDAPEAAAAAAVQIANIMKTMMTPSSRQLKSCLRTGR
jgi:hypothetical protein